MHMLPWGLWRTKFFFLPKNHVQLAPQSFVLLENSTELISNFFKFFLFLRKGQEHTENTKKKFGIENFF